MFVFMGGIGGNRGSSSSSNSQTHDPVVASVNIHGTTMPPCEEQWRFEGNVVADPSALSDAPHNLLGKKMTMINLTDPNLNPLNLTLP